MSHVRRTGLLACSALLIGLLFSPVRSGSGDELPRRAVGQASPGGTLVDDGLGVAASGDVHAAQTGGPDVQVPTNVVYYDIVGATDEALRNQVRQLGPGDASGRWTASTRWTYSWSFSYAVDASGCTSGPVRIQVAVTFTYPKWSPPADAAPSLVDRWNRYLDAVAVHENGHRDIAADGGRELARALEALPPAPTCAALDGAARGVIDEVVARYNQLQVNYDRITAHGATQGAVFR